MTADTPSPRTEHATQANITAYWNLRGPSYDAEPGHFVADGIEMDAWVADVGALLPPPPAGVLDVGTGTGFLSILLARLGHRVTGIDPSTGMLARARERSAGMEIPPTFVEGDGHAPPFPPASFDVVASRHVLWTLREPAAAFAAWWRVLRPGGRALAIDGLWFQNRGNDPALRQTSYAEAWARLYSDSVRSGLPLMNVASMEPALALLRDAGFVDVQLHRLERVEAYHRDHQPTASGGTAPRYAIVAARPQEWTEKATGQ